MVKSGYILERLQVPFRIVHAAIAPEVVHGYESSARLL